MQIHSLVKAANILYQHRDTRSKRFLTDVFHARERPEGMVDILSRENGWASDINLIRSVYSNFLSTDKEEKDAHEDYGMARQARLDLDGFCELGHNVWLLKLVTKLYQNAQAHTGQYALLSLHTRTPVTAVTHETANNSSTSTVVTNRGSPGGIIPTRGQVMATRAPVGTDQIKLASWSGNEGFAYWFSRPVTYDTEKPLIINGGGREAAAPSYELHMDNDSKTHTLVGNTLREFLHLCSKRWASGKVGLEHRVCQRGRALPQGCDQVREAPVIEVFADQGCIDSRSMEVKSSAPRSPTPSRTTGADLTSTKSPHVIERPPWVVDTHMTYYERVTHPPFFLATCLED
ncbi:hypothetical protein DEU56DRAFT_754880 [Suillus clintonianus]|uniref:uncharacterized protein n=1 Tax=Suillus clintonianus TaxID=1904413 RepID=UPI001B87878C|nr:uncharacterized protein DEU56DRAFT_754880 [Suillus clintonianus]KAG2141919.1 hypothetical protein DEU56DRAFT_754880 [Suillus clintonianus]